MRQQLPILIAYIVLIVAGCTFAVWSRWETKATPAPATTTSICIEPKTSDRVCVVAVDDNVPTTITVQGITFTVYRGGVYNGKIQEPGK